MRRPLSSTATADAISVSSAAAPGGCGICLPPLHPRPADRKWSGPRRNSEAEAGRTDIVWPEAEAGRRKVVGPEAEVRGPEVVGDTGRRRACRIGAGVRARPGYRPRRPRGAPSVLQLLLLQWLLLIPLPSLLLPLMHLLLPCHFLLRMLSLLKPLCLPPLPCRRPLRRHHRCVRAPVGRRPPRQQMLRHYPSCGRFG